MKKNKEHKKAESTIGKIIYGFLLFMPLFAIGVTCLTHVFNKEVSATVQNNIVNYQFETNEINSANDVYNGRIYHVKIDSAPQTDIQFADLYAVYNLDVLGLTKLDVFSIPDRNIRIFANPSSVNRFYVQSVGTGGTETFYAQLLTEITFPIEFDIAIKLQSNMPWQYLSESTFLPIESITTETITTDDSTNIFYSAVDMVTESPLFSWAQNSIIYTTLNNTCNTLSITTPFIPLLLAYWLIISVIYFLYDIALMLIWLLHDKIHEMRDSLA